MLSVGEEIIGRITNRLLAVKMSSISKSIISKDEYPIKYAQICVDVRALLFLINTSVVIV